MMTAEEFKALAAAYGSEIERWPAETRVEARRIADDSAAMSRVLAAEAALDDALDQWPALPPSPDLARRIREAARLEPQVGEAEGKAPMRLGRWLWAQVAGAAVAAMIGFAVGWTGTWSIEPSSADTVDLSEYVFDGGFDFEEDLENDT